MKFIIFSIVILVIISGCVQKEKIRESSVTDKIVTVDDTSNIEEDQNSTTANNTRWGKTELNVFVDEKSSFSVKEFNRDLVKSFKEATDILEKSTGGNINFNFVDRREGSDIEVKWVESLPSDSLDAIGHTEFKFIVGQKFNIISSAKIKLLTKKDGKTIEGNDAILLSLHEIGHSLGLNHSSRKESMMYPELQENLKGPSKTDIEDILNLYETESLPDLIIQDEKLTKRTLENIFVNRYLADVNFSVTNNGLTESGPFSFSIEIGDKKIESQSTSLKEEGSITPGGVFNIAYWNLSSSTDFSNITIKIDENNLIKELNESNNMKTLQITST